MVVLMTLGIIIGLILFIVVGVLRLTMREEPTGCFIVFGLTFLFMLAGAIVPQIILAW